MAAGADNPGLEELYEQLKGSMKDVDTIIEQLDRRLAQAHEEWRSKGAHEFNDAWHNGFKPSLTKLCQALATAGTDVAFQHNQGTDESVEGSDQRRHLAPVKSPR